LTPQKEEGIAGLNQINFWENTGETQPPQLIASWINAFNQGTYWQAIANNPHYSTLPYKIPYGPYNYDLPGTTLDWLPWWLE